MASNILAGQKKRTFQTCSNLSGLSCFATITPNNSKLRREGGEGWPQNVFRATRLRTSALPSSYSCAIVWLQMHALVQPNDSLMCMADCSCLVIATWSKVESDANIEPPIQAANRRWESLTTSTSETTTNFRQTTTSFNRNSEEIICMICRISQEIIGTDLGTMLCVTDLLPMHL